MIYFVADYASGSMKVGYAKSDPFQRMLDLQCGNSNELALVYASSHGDRETESAIHYYLRDYHIRGEWFLMEAFGFRTAMDFEQLIGRATLSLDVNTSQTRTAVKPKPWTGPKTRLQHAPAPKLPWEGGGGHPKGSAITRADGSVRYRFKG